ncbi:hybrid sensor histidine kinase/response regulator [Vineibacter terrae]|uniref:ATP-binding response regulator n=1 Tax=Vineibacter terrae TaxID=2586908 RepID=UPI002E34FD66|nr:hybrid sensor histidine kinase/response regulator [Vineibacter terrae]HEX2887045.1 hybrid sensor histidine kinase/response regulator [Vineibacter terrae]
MAAEQELPIADQNAETLRRTVAKLTEINRALMSRVEHSLDMQGNAYQLFQTAILLDQKVRERTRELEHALQAVEQSNLELRAAKVEAERANVSKTKFLADASHDLLQPLNAARLLVAALQETARSGNSQTILSRIDHALGNVEDLLNTLLEMSKLDSGHVSATIQPVRLAPLMEALREELVPITAPKGLAFTLMPSALTVQSDPHLLRRLLQNFLSNACRYTAAGRVLFGVRRRGPMAELQVHDTGVGIPAEKLDEIFEEFRRLEPPQGGAPKGYGLGLSIVKRISRLLGYQVKVASTPGRGSCFSVLVPIADMAARGPASLRPRPASAGAVNNIRVLVVDNDRTVLDAMTRLLEAWRCRTIAVASRAELQVHPTDVRPDILLVDYHLDDGDLGTTLIADIRRRWGADIPAAIITADRSPEAHAAAQLLPAVSLLLKPIKPARLRALVASVRR